MLKRPAILCACLLVAAALILGLVHLFQLRFDRVDLYPPYSTLRTDPLGASVFYESLEQVPGISAQRFFEPTFKTDDGRSHALFILGAWPGGIEELSRPEFDTLQRFVYSGGRVVIAYCPMPRETWTRRLAETNGTHQTGSKNKDVQDRRQIVEKGDNKAGHTNKAAGPVDHKKQSDLKDQDRDDEDTKAEKLKYADLSGEWGFALGFNDLASNEDGKLEFPNASRMAPMPELPAMLPIHTALYFTNLTNGWITIYQRDKRMPVVAERSMGAGSIALLADSYPFSNEALFKDRSAPLLAWLLGGGRQVIFDEAHLGIVEEPGMATLMRRYQLHGLIFGLLLVAGLFVWKNSQSLVPPPPESDTGAGAVVAGRDSASGFVNLVRRGIPPAQLINVCYAEWKKSNPRHAVLSATQRDRIEQIIQQQAALEPRKRNPVENYRDITGILLKRL